MTYGWALMVIVIVIGVLVYINPFKAPEQCSFDQAGFLCQKPILLSSGVLHGTLINGNQKAITITGIACIRGRTAPSGLSSSWPGYAKTTKSLNYNDQIDDLGNFQNDANNAFHVSCVDVTTVNGVAVFPTTATITLHSGDQFSGRLYIAYNYADDPAGAISKVVGANLVTNAQ